MSKHLTPFDMLFEVLKTQHKDINKSAQLLPKVKLGCEQFLEQNGFDYSTANEEKKSENKTPM